MKPLKTLKDLNTECLGDEENEELWIDVKQLKAEAIKWVNLSHFDGMEDGWEAFEKFFNITSEDLK